VTSKKQKAVILRSVLCDVRILSLFIREGWNPHGIEPEKRLNSIE
jgi:hypothetical protein